VALFHRKLTHGIGHSLHGGLPVLGLDGDGRLRLRLCGEELTLCQLKRQLLELVEVTLGLVDVSNQPAQPGA
jgi:hypothetical protein